MRVMKGGADETLADALTKYAGSEAVREYERNARQCRVPGRRELDPLQEE